MLAETNDGLSSVLSNYVTLNQCSYYELMGMKDEVLKESDAMQTIVAMATMKPEVLMADLRSKKKRIIARIDATPEGTKFLIKSLRTEPDEDAKEIYRSRIKVGKDLAKQREKINKEFVIYQKGWNKFTLTRFQRANVLNKFLNSKIDFITSTTQSLLEVTNNTDHPLVFVNSVLVDELIETKEKIEKDNSFNLLLP